MRWFDVMVDDADDDGNGVEFMTMGLPELLRLLLLLLLLTLLLRRVFDVVVMSKTFKGGIHRYKR